MRTDEDEGSEVVEGNTGLKPPLLDILSDMESDALSLFSLSSLMSDDLSDTNSEIDPSSDSEKCKCIQAIYNAISFSDPL